MVRFSKVATHPKKKLETQLNPTHTLHTVLLGLHSTPLRLCGWFSLLHHVKEQLRVTLLRWAFTSSASLGYWWAFTSANL